MSNTKNEEVMKLLLNDLSQETLLSLSEKTITSVLDGYDVQQLIKEAMKPEIEKAIVVVAKTKAFQTVVSESVKNRISLKVEALTIEVLDELVRTLRTK